MEQLELERLHVREQMMALQRTGRALLRGLRARKHLDHTSLERRVRIMRREGVDITRIAWTRSKHGKARCG